jgi:hypothetical protein
MLKILPDLFAMLYNTAKYILVGVDYHLLSFWKEKLYAPLIAAYNVDNENRRQKKGKKLNYKPQVILMKKE